MRLWISFHCFSVYAVEDGIWTLCPKSVMEMWGGALFRRSGVPAGGRNLPAAGRRFAGRNAAFGNSSPAEKGIRNSGIRLRQGGPSHPLEYPLRRDAIVCAKTHKYFWPCSFCRCVCMRFGGRASGSISCSGPKFQPEGRARKERVLFPPHPSRSRHVRMSRNVRSG